MEHPVGVTLGRCFWSEGHLTLTEKYFCIFFVKSLKSIVIKGSLSPHNIQRAKWDPKQGSQKLAQKFYFKTCPWPRCFVKKVFSWINQFGTTKEHVSAQSLHNVTLPFCKTLANFGVFQKFSGFGPASPLPLLISSRARQVWTISPLHPAILAQLWRILSQPNSRQVCSSKLWEFPYLGQLAISWQHCCHCPWWKWEPRVWFQLLPLFESTLLRVVQLQSRMKESNCLSASFHQWQVGHHQQVWISWGP